METPTFRVGTIPVTCLWQAPCPSCTQGCEDQRFSQQPPSNSRVPAQLQVRLITSTVPAENLGTVVGDLKKHGAPHQFAVTCHQNRAVQTVESRLFFGALRWVSAEGPVATGACGTGASQGDPGPQRSAGPFALGCLPDRQHGLPGFLSLAWFLSDDSEYAHSTSLLRLISRGRQKVILHGQK